MIDFVLNVFHLNAALVDVDQKIVSARKPHNKLLHYPRERKRNSFFPLESMTEVNQEPRFTLSVNAESFVPKEDETQIVATACFKNKCLLSTALILVKDKYSEWQTFRALLDSGSETCLISNERE
ncbi:hypothetical protein TNCV_562651 [Trichonephila clavipes]|nr:hypothetical protein TNCV_562651 [Trichonephila clavipes]